MRTMIPLRVLALGANVLFIAYGWLSGVKRRFEPGQSPAFAF
jgi:hypothetical protein